MSTTVLFERRDALDAAMQEPIGLPEASATVGRAPVVSSVGWARLQVLDLANAAVKGGAQESIPGSPSHS